MKKNYVRIEGLRCFMVVGRTTDGSSWWVKVVISDEFIRRGRFHVITQFANAATEWDEQHQCKTRQIEASRREDWEYMEA